MTLVLSNIAKHFGGVHAITDFSMEIVPGRITGLIGPNGAGKTTAVNLITGMMKVSGGTITLNGKDITHYEPRDVARAGVSRTFQNIRLLKEASVIDNIMIGFHSRETSGFLANVLGLPSAWREKARFKEEAYALLDRLDMRSYADRNAGALSYGHQRRVEILRALAMSPSVILLDEPAAGMNDVEANELADLFRQFKNENMAVLLIEHNMRLVMSTCDHVYVLATGKAIADGPPAEIAANAAVISAYLGE
jgi:branched-chain amino acid transport system ATP-binding protein